MIKNADGTQTFLLIMFLKLKDNRKENKNMILANLALAALAAASGNPTLPGLNRANTVVYVQENMIVLTAEEFYNLPSQYGYPSVSMEIFKESERQRKFVLYEVETNIVNRKTVRRQTVYTPVDYKYTVFMGMLDHWIGIPEDPWWPNPGPVWKYAMELNKHIGEMTFVRKDIAISDKIARDLADNIGDFELGTGAHLEDLNMNYAHANEPMMFNYNLNYVENPFGALLAKYSDVSEDNGGVMPATFNASNIGLSESLSISINDRVLNEESFNGISKASVFETRLKEGQTFVGHVENFENAAIYASIGDPRYVANQDANNAAAAMGVFANNNAPQYFAQNPLADWLDGFNPAQSGVIFDNDDYVVAAQGNAAQNAMVARPNRMGNGNINNALPIVAKANND